MFLLNLLLCVGFLEVGGYEGATFKFMRAVPNTTVAKDFNDSCGIPPDNSLTFVRSHDDPDYPWPGVFFGLTISSVWYWCSDQVELLKLPAPHLWYYLRYLVKKFG